MTKKYKVGDTVYIKDEIETVDQLDSYRTYRGIHNGWLNNISIVDELPTAEPVKPMLPKFVANLVDDHEDGFGTLGSLIGSVYAPKSSVEKLVNDWIYQDNRENVRYKMLVDAYFNGYTVEKPKPKLYNLILGIDSNDHRSAFYKGFRGVIINADTSIGDLDDLHYQFTQEEIDKLEKDSWVGGTVDFNAVKCEVE